MNFLRHFHNAHAQAYEYNGSVCTISLDLRINRHFQPISKYFRVIGQMLQCYWGVIHHLRGILFGKVAVLSYHPPLGMFRSSIHNPCPSKLYNYKMKNIQKTYQHPRPLQSRFVWAFNQLSLFFKRTKLQKYTNKNKTASHDISRACVIGAWVVKLQWDKKKPIAMLYPNPTILL